MLRQFAHCRGVAALLLTGLISLGALPARAEMLLVMVQEPGCMWCARWNAEIAPIYPKTAEGRAARLVRMDIHDTPPDGMAFSGRLTYTPTFVLVDNGHEIGRIEGYPGEDFFWGLLARMIKEAEVPDGRS